MAHCGVSLDHPDNAAVVARLTKPHVIEDRPGLIRKLEELQQKQPSAAVLVWSEGEASSRPLPTKGVIGGLEEGGWYPGWKRLEASRHGSWKVVGSRLEGGW